MGGFNDFAPYIKECTSFIVKNVSPQKKTIKIFTYPINLGCSRDLLMIPGVSESDIRASLLKGELRHKFLAEDIQLVFSDIDLLQFNDCHKEWLQSLGFGKGTEVGFDQLDGYLQSIIGGGGSLEPAHKTLRDLIHFIDEGPGDGFASGALKEVLPTGSPFPTTIIWWLDAGKTLKLVEKLITYTPNKFPATITWKMYDYDGVTLIHTVIDTMTYSSAFESTRSRTIV